MRGAWIAIGSLVVAGCADERLAPSDLRPVELAIWNSTQRPIEEVRVHEEVSYRAAPNLLASALPDDARADVEFLAGKRVTVIRRNVDGGTRIAFSTAYGLDVRTPGWVLQVFQESFRLHAPDPYDGPFSDGDAPDGGDPNSGQDGNAVCGDDAAGDPALADDGGGDP
jgi:hypothetical protein